MFTVIYDANVLHPAPLRDLVIRVARLRFCHVPLTDAILDEVFDSLLERRTDLDPKELSPASGEKVVHA